MLRQKASTIEIEVNKEIMTTPTSTPTPTPTSTPTPTPTSTSTPTPKRTHYLNWNDTFMCMASVAAQRSKDPSTQVGACIVDSKQRIVAIGYNGFPRGCDDDVFPWSKSPDNRAMDNKYYYVVHAEQNAIHNCNQIDLGGNTLYVTQHPCHECAKHIIQSGIRHVFYKAKAMATIEGPVVDDSILAARKMFKAAGVELELYVPCINSLTLVLNASRIR
jgi:dCMP deaminase